MVYYLHHLSPPTIPHDIPGTTDPAPELLSPIPSQIVPPLPIRDFQNSEMSDENHNLNISISLDQEAILKHISKPVLLLAGYSYGSLITSLLPPILTSLLTPFQSPAPGSTYAEIRMRSSSLATSQNVYINTTISSLLSTHRRVRSLYTDALTSPKVRKSSGGVRVGGEEDLRRASHESHRRRSSFATEAEEIVRKSVDRVRSIGKRPRSYNGRDKRISPMRQNTASSVTSRRSFSGNSVFSNETDDGSSKIDEQEGYCKAILGIGEDLQTAYLLISPIQGFLHNLATMFSAKFSVEHEVKLTVDPTLAIFGNDDVFVSIKKIRAWSERLAETNSRSGKGKSKFRYVEVNGAGHFWHDHDAIRTLQDEINIFLRTL